MKKIFYIKIYRPSNHRTVWIKDRYGMPLFVELRFISKLVCFLLIFILLTFIFKLLISIILLFEVWIRILYVYLAILDPINVFIRWKLNKLVFAAINSLFSLRKSLFAQCMKLILFQILHKWAEISGVIYYKLWCLVNWSLSDRLDLLLTNLCYYNSHEFLREE